MIKIGITGGIGSGKSTVCEVLELLDVPIYYTDSEAKKMLDADIVRENIIVALGNEVLDEKGWMDRKKIASIVFKDTTKLEKLNSIIHPAVADHFTNWMKHYTSYKYIVKEAAILFESNACKLVDKVITVVAPKELRIKRTMQRDNISREQVEERMKFQMSDEEKIKRSEFVIHNDEQQLLIPQILFIHQQLSE